MNSMEKGETKADASKKQRKEGSKASVKTLHERPGFEAGPSGDIQSEVDKTRKKKKKKKAAVSDVGAAPATEVPVKKNRKRRRADSESATAFPDPSEENTTTQPKKKRRKKFANPTKDKSLPEPALRGNAACFR